MDAQAETAVSSPLQHVSTLNAAVQCTAQNRVPTAQMHMIRRCTPCHHLPASEALLPSFSGKHKALQSVQQMMLTAAVAFPACVQPVSHQEKSTDLCCLFSSRTASLCRLRTAASSRFLRAALCFAVSPGRSSSDSSCCHSSSAAAPCCWLAASAGILQQPMACVVDHSSSWHAPRIQVTSCLACHRKAWQGPVMLLTISSRDKLSEIFCCRVLGALQVVRLRPASPRLDLVPC